ncbi:MAG: phosphatidate cytidylyltransferase [Treponema sp.]|nr:phosphatidate cytidylyltransferase [Treponema sp.]
MSDVNRVGDVLISRPLGVEAADSRALKSELIRKSLHFLIALCPFLAAFNRPLSLALLAAGTLFYTIMEALRLRGIRIPLISWLTVLASRPGDADRFVLGPVSLGLGALLSLLFFPPAAASIAIYALAFGDGFSNLIGKFAGHIRPAFLRGKSLEGSAACFLAVWIAASLVSSDSRVIWLAALTATVVDAMPLHDYDNIAMPLMVGLVVQLCGLAA